MLTELCQELRNWFDLERHNGTFTIEGGSITAPFLLSGQYFRVVGSVFNDGVHCFGDENDELTDETFDGAVWALGIPKAVLDLSREIDEWCNKYADVNSAAMSPFTSESFGGYSYSKSGGASTSGNAGDGATWQGTFRSRLNMWRKI